MKLVPPLVALLLASTLALPARAANVNVDVNPNNRFSPEVVNIQVGDTVTWTNRGGVHNVVADDLSFRCANGCDGAGGNGTPSAAAWSVTVTFNDPGSIPYNCEVHVGLGMRGTVNVSGGGGGQPGTLRFANTNFPVNESAPSATVTVQRVNGDDGAVSVQYSTSNGSATAGSDYTATSGTLNWADNDDDPKTFQVPILDDNIDEPNETIQLALSGAAGGASIGNPGNATVTIQDNDTTQQNPGTISFSSATYDTDEGDGNATITVDRTNGMDGAVSAAFATADGSATAGSDYQAAAGTVSWADGDGASKTFQVPIVDDSDSEPTETVQLSLSGATGGASLGTAAADLRILDDDVETGPCVPGAETLCLNQDGRFRAEIEWADPFGNSGPGQAVEIGRRDSGLFYFFDENNIEMLVKVINACALPAFQSYWVFYAATTNVEFTLTVTDTQTGQVKQYFNPQGNAAAPIQDTRAFSTCP